MTLRCSLLGHQFEEAAVEREREERGDEVVTVSREVETCSRCDARRVISESTEITTVGPAPDDVTERDTDGFGSVVERSGADDHAAGTRDDDGAEAFEPPDDPAEEDAEILTDEDDGERQPGEWPDEPAATLEETSGATDVTTTDASTQPPESQDLAPEAETFVCPECGFTTAIEGSSLRQGDVCPKCMDGYLETR